MLRAFLDTQGRKVVINPRRVEAIQENGAGKADLVFNSGQVITVDKPFDEVVADLGIINEMGTTP